MASKIPKNWNNLRLLGGRHSARARRGSAGAARIATEWPHSASNRPAVAPAGPPPIIKASNITPLRGIMAYSGGGDVSLERAFERCREPAHCEVRDRGRSAPR